MAIKRGSKVETSFGSASMTDMMFLLLIFLMVATTLINNNALKIMLPQGSNKASDKPTTTITVTKDLHYYINNEPIKYADIEPFLQSLPRRDDKEVIMLSIDKRVTVDELAKLMNIVTRNNFLPFLMTEP